MKKIICYFFGILLFCSSVFAEGLPLEKQQEIIDNYLFIMGQREQLSTASESDSIQPPIKCGFPMIHQFQMNRDKFDQNLLKSSGALDVQVRPDLSDSIVSPAGHFMIHFDRSGNNIPYSNVPGGIDGYIDSVALILDYVYGYIIDTLGYPPPPADSFYPSGGDERYDVYIVDFSGAVYGLTYGDTIIVDMEGDSVATSFLELDNDYAELVQYDDRPLDAIRVTAAHEFFHAVHLGLDYFESGAIANDIEGPAWMEMSSVWMEEEIYDGINDYYNYLPYFFNVPWISIQEFNPVRPLHPYASAVFPIFLTEKYDRDIIRSIWLKCGEYGPGPHFLQSTEEVIDSVSGGLETYESLFNEFAVWNYFTGERADAAPTGYKYSEAVNYPMYSAPIGGAEVRVISSYPETVGHNEGAFFHPESNGAFYIKYRRLPFVQPDYYCYDSVLFDIVTDSIYDCIDSILVDSIPDTIYQCTDSVYMGTIIDTTYQCTDSIPELVTFLSLDLDNFFSNPWGLTILGEDRYTREVTILDRYELPAFFGGGILVDNPSLYNSVTFILTPASANRNFYVFGSDMSVAYGATNDMYLDSIPTNAEPTSFYPFPNPAVVSEMQNEEIKFKFELATDSLGVPITNNGATPYLTVDIFNIAGERVKTLNQLDIVESSVDDNVFVLNWDMKNDAGKDVASGVYLAFARFYDKPGNGNLLLEDKTKIAIIR